MTGADPVLGPGLLTSMWRYRWLVAATTMLALLTAALLSMRQERLYEAVSTVLLRDPNGSNVVLDSRPRNIQPFAYASTQAVLVRSSPVVAAASALLDQPVTAAELEGVSVQAAPDVLLLTVTVRGADPVRAAALANALPEAYEQVSEANLRSVADRSIAELEKARAALTGELARIDGALADATARGVQSEIVALQSERFAVASELGEIASIGRGISVEAVLFGSGVQQREEAVVPSSPVSPRPRRDALLGALLGLLVGTGAAWVLNTRRLSRDERRGPEALLGAPLLGEIPTFEPAVGERGVPVLEGPQSEAAESYRFLATALSFRLPTEGAVLLVTSAARGDGKTVTSLNLALAQAQEGRDVVLLDANPSTPALLQLREQFPQSPGDDPHVVDFPGTRDQGRLVTARGGSMRVVSVDHNNSRAPDLSSTLDALRATADVVVVDAAPLLVRADAVRIAGSVDGVLVVITPKTGDEVLLEVQRQLALTGAAVLGYVLNRPGSQPAGEAGDADRRTGDRQSVRDWARPAVAESAHSRQPRAQHVRTGTSARWQDLKRLVTRGRAHPSSP